MGTIGVFDSGVGGLSVLREIRALLPHERLDFVADTAFAPYGDKPETLVRERALFIAGILRERGARAIVVACNTATAAAVPLLRRHCELPVIGMEPAVKPAAAATRCGTVGVLATEGTLESARFAALLARFGTGIDVVTRPCPGLVERIEAGELDTPRTRALVARHLEPLRAAGADTIVLGCTHYPLIRPLIAELAGPEVRLIDTGRAVARQLARTLDDRGLHAPAGARGDARFQSSGDCDRAAAVIRRLWGEAVDVAPLEGGPGKE